LPAPERRLSRPGGKRAGCGTIRSEKRSGTATEGREEHASSVAVSREHRRAKTDRLDTELLKRAFLGWAG
jgi:hypothetical protein